MEFEPFQESFFSFVHLVLVSLPIIIFFGILAFAVDFCSSHPRRLRLVLWYASCFSVMGLMIGYTTGASRESAVAALIPASISLLGGIGALAFSKSTLITIAAISSVTAFSFSLALGVMVGAKARFSFEEYQNSYDTRAAAIDTEYLLQLYRDSIQFEPSEDVNVDE